MTNATNRMLVFTGSYADTTGSGLYVYQFDEEKEQLTLLHEYGGLKNPTFLNVDLQNNRLYAITEGVSESGAKTGDAAAYDIDPVSGALTMLNRGQTVDSTTCHIARDKDSKHIIVTSYHGGMVGLVGLTEDGQIGERLDSKQHDGKGTHPERQDRPHPHSSTFSPDGRFVYVQDLGLDVIVQYAIDNDKLVRIGETVLHPGAGPRHMTFHPNAPYTFVINEVDSTVTVFKHDAQSGSLTAVQTISTLPPEGFDGENTCAEITVSRDGRFVYGSNRGHDSIVVYSFDEAAGTLAVLQIVSVEGRHPRHFALTPSGNHLLAANKDSNNITVFRVNRDTGAIAYTGSSAALSMPVCVLPCYY
ncbi:lactonase family protein [Paenibacillus xylaniclasticus]|uniref:lactonase family protein n=1 Tax=Paenibacillus xylaniclasticus TaxID=588083 RepID=UPI000FD833C3|nr:MULTISPECIES: lactonase family protein [Paenibacillus]GFN31747.1 hypothetical protein PCURB6_20070 [Paenibacillus curdlanolyticus]